MHSNMTRCLQQILTQAVITIPLIPNVILGKYWIKQKYKLWSEMDQFSMQIDTFGEKSSQSEFVSPLIIVIFRESLINSNVGS